MTDPESVQNVKTQHHQQMLKLVARSFYTELVKYGIQPNDVITVAGHLLDQLLPKTNPVGTNANSHSHLFTLHDISDHWTTSRRLDLQHIALVPFPLAAVDQMASWLQNSATQASFFPPFPTTAAELTLYFQQSDRSYFLILYQDNPVGTIGAEHIDATSGKLEMRKLIGDPAMRGKGIGKRATFLFLYYAFIILRMHKVYIHSDDLNIRNINLNNRFGFEIEGLFIQDCQINHTWHDIVRMGLLRDRWLDLFSAQPFVPAPINL